MTMKDIFTLLKKFTKDSLTTANGVDYDLGRILWMLAFLVGVGLEIFCVITNRTFDLQQYGVGIGALLLAGGGALNLKAKTEPS